MKSYEEITLGQLARSKRVLIELYMDVAAQLGDVYGVAFYINHDEATGMIRAQTIHRSTGTELGLPEFYHIGSAEHAYLQLSKSAAFRRTLPATPVVAQIQNHITTARNLAQLL